MSRQHPDVLAGRIKLQGWLITARSPSSKSDYVVWPGGQLEQIKFSGNPSQHHSPDKKSHMMSYLRGSPEHGEVLEAIASLQKVKDDMQDEARKKSEADLDAMEKAASRTLFGADAVIEVPEARPAYEIPDVGDIVIPPACLHPWAKVIRGVCTVCGHDLNAEALPPSDEPTAEETEEELEAYAERPDGVDVDESDMGDTVAPVVTSEPTTEADDTVTPPVTDPPNTATRWSCPEADPHFNCCTVCAHHNGSPQADRGHQGSKAHVAAVDAAA